MICGERVKQARELRGIKQDELAARVSTSQSAISQIEAGIIQPSDEVLAGIALQTGFPLAFFRQGPPVDFPFGSLMYRAQKSMTAEDKKVATRYGQTLFEIAEGMASRMNLPALTLPRLKEDAKTAARITRTALGLAADTPIPNIINVIERAGVLVLMLPFTLAEGDAFSEWVGSDVRKPTIVLIGSTTGDRLRMTVAHELGHLVMHPRGSIREMEDDAWTFAREFLVPELAMRQEMIPPITLSGLAAMKVRWGVSIIALMLFARRLNLITKSQYEYLHAQLRQRGWQKREPSNLDIPIEKPRAVGKMAELMYGKPINYQRLASDAKVPVPFAQQAIEAYARLEDIPPRDTRDTPLGDNISSFRQRGEWNKRDTNVR